ncbi:MAG: hypothetical protein AAGU74_05930 [Bacillota bacterium]
MDQKWRFRVCVALILAVAFFICGCSNGEYQKMGGELETMRQNIVEAEAISAKLVEICNAQIEDIKSYWEEYDEAIKSGEEMPEEDAEESLKETQQIYDELLLQIDALDALQNGQTFDGQTGSKSFDDTVTAYQMYLSDLKLSADDMKVVFDYFFDMREALLPITEFEYVENTSGYVDYALMAGQLTAAVAEAQGNLADVSYPSFMQNSHNAISERIDEFQAYNQDFSIAVQLSDPLRLASCVYRADRITLLLTEDERSMDTDFTLQFEHAVKRLEERVKVTHDELIANIDALLSAIG